MIDSLKNKITLGDSFEILKDIPDNMFDLLLTDPPYGIDFVGQTAKNDGKWGYSKWEYKPWDTIRPSETEFREMIRVSKNQVIWGGNYFADLLPPSQGWLVWNKGQREFSLADGELAWTSFNKAVRIFDYSRAKALQDGKIHPTQKPVALFAWVLQLRTKRGDLILDCFSGSGTTAVACHKLRRSFVCIECDPDYYKMSVERLKNITAQQRLEICV